MNKNFKNTLMVFILLICTVTGCNNKKKDIKSTPIITMNFDENEWNNKVYFKKNTDLQMVFFNESENVIGDITSIRVFDDYFLFYEQSRDLLFLYSNNGKYLSSIGKKGNGPEEYTRITYYDVYTDKGKSVIEILDANRHELQVYNLSGKLIETKKLKKDVNGFSFMHTSYGYFFYTPDNGNNVNKKYMLVLCSPDLKKIKNKFLIDNCNLVPKVDNNFVKNSKEILFHYGYNDTIYKISEENVIPYIYVDFGSRKVANSNLSTKKTIKEFEDVLYFSNKCYLGNINTMLLNDNKLMFRFSDIKINVPVNNFYGEFDLNNRKSRFSKFVASEFPFGFSIIHMEKDFLIGIVYPYHLDEKGINYFKEVHNQNINRESNPILVKIYEKN